LVSKIGRANHEVIRQTQDFEAFAAKPIVALRIDKTLRGGFMRRAVNFDYQSFLETDEISDVTTDRYLPSELEGLRAADHVTRAR
jgi:hypothetical protein